MSGPTRGAFAAACAAILAGLVILATLIGMAVGT
jgi:hypothetical protein